MIEQAVPERELADRAPCAAGTGERRASASPDWVIYASGIAWGGHRNRQHELALELARTRRVLFLEPPGLRSSLSLHVEALDRNLWRATQPALLPLGRFVPPANVLNRIHTAKRLRTWLDLRPGRRLLWIDEDIAAPLVGRLDEAAVIYDAADLDWTFTRRWNRWHLRRGHRRAARAADLVLASSAPLAEALRAGGLRPVEILNGCDPDHLCPDARPHTPVHEPAQPVLGYVGAIGERAFDTALVASVARAHPQWKFVLAGKASPRALDALSVLPNVHFPGIVSYDALPELIGGFDVGLIPYRSQGLVDYVFPKKLYEYMAMGKPVVATPLPALAGVEEVHRAGTADDFAAAVEAALAEAGSPGFEARQRAAACANSWQRRGDRVRALVDGMERRSP
jgi:glycosyltransferase involved in cell wall biosynthesis